MDRNSSIQPKLKTGCSQPYVAIPIRLTIQEWSKANALAHEVKLWISSKNIKIAGPMFYRYLLVNKVDLHVCLEVGFPVCTAVKGDGRIVTGTIPGGTFATLIHCGNPNQINCSFEVLQNWANEKCIKWQTSWQGNKETFMGRFDFCLTNSADEPNRNNWRTAIAVLIDELAPYSFKRH